MVRSSGFGSIRSDRGRPIQTCFRSGFRCFSSLTKPLPISRQSILPKVRSQALQLSYRLSAYGFMFYFTPRQGFSFTFPSRYLFTIGHSGVFSLTRWSSQIHTGFHVPHATRDKKNNDSSFSTTGLSPSLVQDSAASSKLDTLYIFPPTTPQYPKVLWFRLIPFRSPLLRESRLLSSPLATKMFQFTRLSLPSL